MIEFLNSFMRIALTENARVKVVVTPCEFSFRAENSHGAIDVVYLGAVGIFKINFDDGDVFDTTAAAYVNAQILGALTK